MSDFVRVSDKGMIDIIENLEDIVDFNYYKKFSIESLSHLLVSKNLFCTSAESRRRVDHETQAIQDIITYKKGELEYTVPLVADDRMKVTVLGYTVVSTNCDNKFIVQSCGENSQDLDVIIDTIRKEAINTNEENKTRVPDSNDIGYCVSEPVVPEFLTGREFLKFFLEINGDRVRNKKTIEEYFDMMNIDYLRSPRKSGE